MIIVTWRVSWIYCGHNVIRRRFSSDAVLYDKNSKSKGSFILWGRGERAGGIWRSIICKLYDQPRFRLTSFSHIMPPQKGYFLGRLVLLQNKLHKLQFSNFVSEFRSSPLFLWFFWWVPPSKAFLWCSPLNPTKFSPSPPPLSHRNEPGGP